MALLIPVSIKRSCSQFHLQLYETTAKVKYLNAKKANVKVPPQKPDEAIHDADFSQARRFHREGMLSLVDNI